MDSHFRDNTIDFLNSIFFWNLQLLIIIHYYLNLYIIDYLIMSYTYFVLNLIGIFKDIFIYLNFSYDLSLRDSFICYSLYNPFILTPIVHSNKDLNMKNYLSYNSSSSDYDTSYYSTSSIITS
jgi:hypothetical protein